MPELKDGSARCGRGSSGKPTGHDDLLAQPSRYRTPEGWRETAPEPALRAVTIWNEHDEEVGMNSLTCHLARLTAVTFSILFFVVGTTFLASAQLLPMADPDICTTPISGVGAEASFLVENDAAIQE